MLRARGLVLLLGLAAAFAAHADYKRTYAEGLDAARAGDWGTVRQKMQEALAEEGGAGGEGAPLRHAFRRLRAAVLPRARRVQAGQLRRGDLELGERRGPPDHRRQRHAFGRGQCRAGRLQDAPGRDHAGAAARAGCADPGPDPDAGPASTTFATDRQYQHAGTDIDHAAGRADDCADPPVRPVPTPTPAPTPPTPAPTPPKPVAASTAPGGPVARAATPTSPAATPRSRRSIRGSSATTARATTPCWCAPRRATPRASSRAAAAMPRWRRRRATSARPRRWRPASNPTRRCIRRASSRSTPRPAEPPGAGRQACAAPVQNEYLVVNCRRSSVPSSPFSISRCAWRYSMPRSSLGRIVQ